MKWFWFALAVTWCCLCGPSEPPSGLARAAGGPQITFKEKHFDFKEVDEGAILEHSFIISNTGDQPLLIEKVAPT